MAVPKLQIFGLIGLLVSCYAVYVETQVRLPLTTIAFAC